MIISRTPLRLSFFGGASDIPSFYSEEPGEVITTAVNKYVYIILKDRIIDNKIRLNYLNTEIVDDINHLKHELARESLKTTKINNSIEITSIADLPAGTGMGSSSSYTVGLLNALYNYKGIKAGPSKLASDACGIEITQCRKPIGKQDQYIAAYGGFQHITFIPELVKIEKIRCSPKIQEELQENIILFYTGITRKADDILTTKMDRCQVRELVVLAKEFHKALEVNDLSDFGRLLDESWKIKKGLAHGISNSFIDQCYEKAKNIGAHGKICGAGGGGILMLYAEVEKHEELTRALSDLTPIKIKMDPEGSKIIYNHSEGI